MPSEIAAFFKVKPQELARWNNVDLDAKLASNMVLQLWVAQDFDTSKAALVDAAHVRVVTVGSPEFFDLVESKRGRKRLTYTVKKGDDLKRIGKKFNLTVPDLERINRFGAARTDLVVGQKLTVYVAMSAAEKAKAAATITPGGVDRPTGDETTTAAPATATVTAAATAREREQLPPVGGELEQARRALAKEPIDSDKEPEPTREAPAAGDRAAEAPATGDEPAPALPRPPPGDGHP